MKNNDYIFFLRKDNHFHVLTCPLERAIFLEKGTTVKWEISSSGCYRIWYLDKLVDSFVSINGHIPNHIRDKYISYRERNLTLLLNDE